MNKKTNKYAWLSNSPISPLGKITEYRATRTLPLKVSELEAGNIISKLSAQHPKRIYKFKGLL